MNTSTTSERRHTVRRTMEASGFLVTPTGLRYPFQTRNLSPSGCFVQLDDDPPLDGDEPLSVYIGDIYFARARVAWSLTESNRLTQLGLVFEDTEDTAPNR